MASSSTTPDDSVAQSGSVNCPTSFEKSSSENTEDTVQIVVICAGHSPSLNNCKIVNLKSSFIPGSDIIKKDSQFGIVLTRCKLCHMKDRLSGSVYHPRSFFCDESKVGVAVPLHLVQQYYGTLLDQIGTVLEKSPFYQGILFDRCQEPYPALGVCVYSEVADAMSEPKVSRVTGSRQLEELTPNEVRQFWRLGN
jgi:hypothetical protein